MILSISATPYIVNHTPASHRGRIGLIISIIIGTGQSLDPIVMGQILSYSSIKSGWIITGLVAVVTAVLMFLLEKYEVKLEKKKIKNQKIIIF
ncbi:hypothetical protein [Tepidibacillus fermentans]|uniref:hypothetical protein n=1 Tax=Tepidibacillus fermentans TaxID=1281767 RepID=UPI003C756BA0